MMARRTKDAPGRVTPKGTRPARSTKTTAGQGRRASSSDADKPRYAREATGRYTAPTPSEYRSSPWWLPTIMLAFFGLGVLSIVLNYLSVLPASPSNYYLLGGLGLIILGFVTSTKWH